MGALRSFLCILYWGPQITFFAYHMGPHRSLSSHTIWGATSDLIFFTKYMGASSDQFLRLLYGAPLRLVSVLTIWVPLRSVSVHTFWGPLSDKFFLLLDGALSDQFIRILYGPGTLRSISLLTICGGPLR